MDALLRRRLMMLGGGGPIPPPPIPEGAIPCELLFTDGYTAYIDSGIVPSRAMSFDTDLLITKTGNSYVGAIGYYISNVRFSPVNLATTGALEVEYGNYFRSNTTFTSRVQPLRNFKVSMTDTGATVTITEGDTQIHSENFTYDSTSVTLSSTNTLGLLGRKTSNTEITSGVWRGGMGRTKFYDDATYTNLIADFYPCYYQGNFGFWDVVGETFHIGNTPANIYGLGAHWHTQGFSPNARLYNGGVLYDNRGLMLSPFLTVPSGCSNIRFNAGTTTNSDAWLCFYDSSKSYVSYFTYNALDREIAVPSNAAFLRLAISVADRDSCYIYDMTNNKYIWKGINVI